jgi:hypothetical protein
MTSIPFALTSAPNIDNFESPFEKGFGQGFAQMSDAVKRVQQKRALNQQDVSLSLQRRAQDINVWQTQVQASLEQKRLNQAAQSQAQNFQLESQKQAFSMATVEATRPLEQAKVMQEMQKTGLEIEALKTGAKFDSMALDKMASMTSMQKSNWQTSEPIIPPTQPSREKHRSIEAVETTQQRLAPQNSKFTILQ